MDHLYNFIFVLFNSAFLLPAVATFFVLGFALGYFTWAKSARQLRMLNREVSELENRYEETLQKPEAPTIITDEPVYIPAGLTASGFVAGKVYGLGKVGERFRGEEDLVTYSEELGVLYKQKPAQIDDLTELAGIDQPTADRMNELGIYTFKQIETLNLRQKKVYESELKLTDLTWDTPVTELESKQDVKSSVEAESKMLKTSINLPTSKPKVKSSPSNLRVENAIADMGAIGECFHGEENQLILDDELGLVYESKPEFVDDLTMLKGISPDQAEQMNLAGIYKFKQLEAMSDAQRANFEELFDLHNIEWNRWGMQLGWGGTGDSTSIGFGNMLKDQFPDAKND